MEQLVSDNYGLIHFLSSIIALISGSLVLIIKKGTIRHKRIGYVYVINMVLLIITSFMIYRLFNGWGIFHYTSIVSLLTLSLGMIPIWTKKPMNEWKFMHFSFMYWSVIGLYSAFVAEVLTRIPGTNLAGMAGISFGIVMLGGVIFFKIYKSKWSNLFKNWNNNQKA